MTKVLAQQPLLTFCKYEKEPIFFRTVFGLPDGIPGLVMVIHTFGDYARFHPHLHAIAADGLFRPSGTFYVLPKSDKQLEEIFRSRILAMLKRKGRIVDDLIQKLMNWRHSGFSVYVGNRIARDDKAPARRHWLTISCAMPLPKRRSLT